MAYPVVTGAVLIEANGAALNNAGQDEGIRADNAIVVKQVRVGRLRYPYVSGQAWRRWWREVLYADFGWRPSQVIRERKSAYTSGDPIQYEEDDIFGYMAARKRGQGQGTQRRISPLKNSLLISVLPNVIERDFGHFSRNLPPGTDYLLFESEHYTTYLQGAFTISLSDVGRFRIGEMYDLSEETAAQYADRLQPVKGFSEQVGLDQAQRIRRVRETLEALARLRGGAHLARNLSDVAPVAVVVGFLDGGNAPFQKLFRPDQTLERVMLDLDRLRVVIRDYADRCLSPGPGQAALWVGFLPGVLANEDEVRRVLQDEPPMSQLVTVAESASDALLRAADTVEAIYARYIG